MLKKLRNLLSKWFSKSKPKEVSSKPLPSSQQAKHLELKIGDSYRLGEMLVTLRASKEEVARIVAKIDARRAAKEAKLRERAIDIMMMTPEQLMQLKFEEFWANRERKEGMIEAIVGKFTGKRYMKPNKQPSGAPKERFNEMMSEVKDIEKVK